MSRLASAAAVLLLLAGCQATNPNASWGRVDVYNRSVASGGTFQVESFHNLNVDCSNIGVPTLRVVTPPAGGTLTGVRGMAFPRFSADNARRRCNSRRAPSLIVDYISRPGFTGQDTARFEVFWTDGDVWTYTLNVNVR
jgi:hypothetical protein